MLYYDHKNLSDNYQTINPNWQNHSTLGVMHLHINYIFFNLFRTKSNDKKKIH